MRSDLARRPLTLPLSFFHREHHETKAGPDNDILPTAGAASSNPNTSGRAKVDTLTPYRGRGACAGSPTTAKEKCQDVIARQRGSRPRTPLFPRQIRTHTQAAQPRAIGYVHRHSVALDLSGVQGTCDRADGEWLEM